MACIRFCKSPGDTVTDLDFLFKPPVIPDPSDDPNLPGTILGQVFNDRNGNGTQNTTDGGVPSVRVFVDANGDGQFNYTDVNTNGVFDAGDTPLERTAVTNEFGGFFLSDISPGLNDIYVIVPADFELTAPPAPLLFRRIDLRRAEF